MYGFGARFNEPDYDPFENQEQIEEEEPEVLERVVTIRGIEVLEDE